MTQVVLLSMHMARRQRNDAHGREARHLIWLIAVTPRRRCLSALAEWLTACPTGGSALMILPTRFCPMMRSTSVCTRLGMAVMRSRHPLPLLGNTSGIGAAVKTHGQKPP